MKSAVSLLFILGALMASCLSALRAIAEEDRRNKMKAWGMFAVVAAASAVVIFLTVVEEIVRAKTL